jgi:thioredoxin-like negative regulator of GroEL
LYCHSEYCGPCRHLTPAVDAPRRTHANLRKLDIAEGQGEVRQPGIQVTPTILLIEDGRIPKALVGANGPPALKIFLGAT